MADLGSRAIPLQYCSHLLLVCVNRNSLSRTRRTALSDYLHSAQGADLMSDLKAPIILNYGGGTNSTAAAVGLHQRKVRPDLVIFADTGGEKPETYQYLEIFSDYLESINFPPLTIVRHKTLSGCNTLEEKCLQGQTLPSIAYGFKSCSSTWKRSPIEKFENHWQPAIDCWQSGGKIIKLLGYDAGEERRATRQEDGKHLLRFPLIEWGWTREKCIFEIRKAGLPLPGKSSCFFCPSTKKTEVLNLKNKYPDLFERALKIERTAAQNPDSPSLKGLGRGFGWGNLAQADENQLKLFADSIELPCGCYDGDDHGE
jgi:hypothetical protein